MLKCPRIYTSLYSLGHIKLLASLGAKAHGCFRNVSLTLLYNAEEQFSVVFFHFFFLSVYSCRL